MVVLNDVGTVPHHSLLALVWTCFSAALLFVILRTVVRFKIATRLTVDDYFIFLALAALLTLCTLETVQLDSLYHITAVIAGRISISTELMSQTEEYLKYEFAIIILFWTVLWFVKAGFLALYFKLFVELPHYRKVWYVLAAFSVVGYAGCVTTLCLSCGSVDKFFRFAGCAGPDQVWASNLSIYFSTAVDVFTDLCIMAMPLKLILNIKQISIKQKAGLVCVFSLCFVMIAFSIIRAKQVLVPQYFVNLTLLMIWSTLAATISVIVGSLPPLKILITNRATRRTRTGSHNNAGGSNRIHRKGSVVLSSLSSDRAPPAPAHIHAQRCPATSESQEEMLRSGGAKFVLVKNEPEFTGPERV
ncbi:unnamed protein product [Parascedosporium putredinis]|uniref:Rhodopsin domain-containing protein n=1 Tax=Parascedosporium putredinis TaxID=1442378 RepID=A0A9P1H2U2_9PEZI|nr:unnamed protein product [Parascedosporium putredinis]CAI7994035.1 unnamed protein product [Parascedosporium putredinis]